MASTHPGPAGKPADRTEREREVASSSILRGD